MAGTSSGGEDSNEIYEVESILATRVLNRKREYLVKWLGYPSSKSTWEPAESISECKEALSKFNRARKRHTQDQPRKSVTRSNSGLAKKDEEKANGSRNSRETSTAKSHDSPATTTSSTSGETSNGKLKVLSAARTDEGKLLFKVQGGEDEFWVTHEDLRNSAPQSLLDFYEARATFE